jgi:tetratricopeptide (TPR) repeat protein
VTAPTLMTTESSTAPGKSSRLRSTLARIAAAALASSLWIGQAAAQPPAKPAPAKPGQAQPGQPAKPGQAQPGQPAKPVQTPSGVPGAAPGSAAPGSAAPGSGAAGSGPVGPATGGPSPQLLPPKPEVPVGPAGRPYSKAEKDVLRELEADLKRYQRAADTHNDRIGDYLVGQYVDRKARLEKRYADQIAQTEAQQRKRHLDAIALLVKFIANYPNHPQFTPDAMFRLADLYLDESNWEFEKRFEASVEADAAPGADVAIDVSAPDGAQGADYSKSIGLWTQIIQRFPDYRQRAGTLYLLAYYLKETGDDRRSLAVYRGLVCSNKYDPMAEPPPPPNRDKVRLSTASASKASFRNPYADCMPSTKDRELVEDAWVRGVGDIHFLTPGELNESIAAYEKVARQKKSKYYDEALYKLAWSYYRNDDFLKAIAAFDESVAYSDALVAQGKDPLPLRPEALQYIAIAFTDPWSLDEQPDPVRALDRAMQFYRDRFNEPHVRDVFEMLGDTFKVLEANEQAVAAWRVAIEKYPLHPLNPLVHQKIVLAYEAKGDSSAADSEAAKLAAAYSPGTEWYAANETNREAMDAQQRIRERMLRAAAENIHKEAQQARAEYVAQPTPQAHDRYVELYRRAAEMYQRFIDEYPTSNDVYEFTYRLGETNFFAEQYMAAIPHYKWVRDHRDLSESRFEKSARSIIQAFQAEIDRQVKAGQLAEPPEPTIETLKAMQQPIRPLDIPPMYRELQTALDEYQQMINDPSSAPNMGLLAGIVSYRFLHLDDAAARFELTFEKFCGTPEAVKAKDGLLAIYEVQGKDEKFRETNERFISQKCGTDQDIQLARAQNRSKEFREAEDLFRDKKYDVAAIAFYRYVKNATPGDPNIPVALYNAAVAYDKSGKPKTAVYLYKEFTDNAAPEFRQSEYYLAALYNTAASNYKAFDYKTAVEGYLNVVKVAGERGRQVPPTFELTLEELQLTALFNAAVIRELDRVYLDPTGAPGTGAVSLYKRYASMEKDRRKADRATWAIARVWSTAGDATKLSAAYADWRKRYGLDQGNADDYVFSYYNMAKVYEKKGKKREMESAKKATVKAWSTVGRPTASAAADMAAEFEFEVVEAFYNQKFAGYKIKAAPKTKREADRVLDALDKLSQDTRNKYLALAKYESGPWGLAALTRVGDTLYFHALKIAEIPLPKDIIKMDAKYPDKGIQAQYMEVLQGLVKPLEDQAKLQWQKVVDTGKSQGLSNQWTQLAQERLHDFISQEEFPVQRTSLTEGTERP